MFDFETKVVVMIQDGDFKDILLRKRLTGYLKKDSFTVVIVEITDSAVS